MYNSEYEKIAETYFNQMHGDSEFECATCDVQFNDEDEYRHHLKTIHEFQEEEESGERKTSSKPTTKEDYEESVVGEGTEFSENGTTAEVTSSGESITIKFSNNKISGDPEVIEAFINKIHAEVLTHVDKSGVTPS